MEPNKDIETAEDWLLFELRHGPRKSADLIRAGEKQGYSAAELMACLWQSQTVIALNGGFWRARQGRNDIGGGGRPIRTTYDNC